MLSVYYEVYMDNEKQVFSKLDTQAWMIGQYVTTGFGDVLRGMFAKKGSKPKITYPEEPIFTRDILLDDEEKKKREEEKKAKELQKQYDRFCKMVGMVTQ